MRQAIALVHLVISRSLSTPGLLFIRLLGTLLAVTLVCGVSLYSNAMGDAMLQSTLGRDSGSQYLAISASNRSLTATEYASLDAYVRHQMANDLGLPITDLYAHHNTANMPIYQGNRPLQAQTAPLAGVVFDYYEGFAGQVRVMEGTLSVPARPARTVIPIALSSSTAHRLHSRVGSRLLISRAGRKALGPPLIVTAIYMPRDPGSAFWADNSGTQGYLSAIVPRFDDFMALQNLPADVPPQFFWRVRTDVRLIHLDMSQHVLDALARVNSRAAVLVPGATLIESLSLDINGFLYQYALLPFILYVLVVPIVAVILYAVAVTTALVIERQAAEIVLLRSRGASNGQILGLYLMEGLLFGLLATLIGPLLGLPLAGAIGLASGFLQFSGGLPFSFSLGPQTVLIGALTALIAFLISLLPAFAAARQSMGAFRQGQTRLGRRPLWQRLFVDLLLLALALYGYWILRRQGAIASSNGQAALAQDPVIALAPLAFALALALLLARVLPWLAALALVLGRRSSAPLSISLQSVARAPRQPMRLVQLLALTLTLGVFAATVAGVVGANAADRALYQAGSTLRLALFNPANRSYQTLPQVRHLPGVRAASLALRIESQGNDANTTIDGSTTVNMLGVDPASLRDVIWFRPDFSDQPMPRLLGHLAGATSPNAIVSPGFLSATGLHIGDAFEIVTAKGRHVRGRVAAVASYFPTLDPTQYPFVVFNLHYLNATTHAPGANEIWLKTIPDPRYLDALVQTVRSDLLLPVIDYQGVAPAFSAADDPLRAGVYGVVSIGFLFALLLALLGLFTYAYLALQRRLGEFAIVRALGLSPAQLRWLLLSEQFFLLGAGVGGGLVGGVLTSRLFLPYMPIASGIIPPFLVTIPWTAIEQFVAVILIAAAPILAAHAWVLMRLQLGHVLRLGEG
ncbi:MAG TPA: FtsX-like permease family protein [Chloroflexota bacterium]|nr:FtsX-like permease family protein [Chloroflexota bacterium]